MKKIRVRLEDRSYDILIGHGLINSCGRIISALKVGTDAVVITNHRVRSLYGKAVEKTLVNNSLTVRFELVEDSEKAKSLSVAGEILDRLSRYDVNRRIFIIALGGGVVGDLAGFISSVYKRGTPYIQVPTTLLAQVDSSIGGKVGVNLRAAKNLVGSFYQPRAVISDVTAIKTLPLGQIRNGLAEVIKYAVIGDAALFKYLELNYNKTLKSDSSALEYIVSKCARIKADIVSTDEFDRKQVRAVLNYGHTIGHAIETAAGYSGSYSHGQAVAIGMLVAVRMASELNTMKTSDAGRIEKLIRNVGLGISVRDIPLSKIYKAHLHDKKFTGRKNRFVLSAGIGSSQIIDNVPDSVVRNALESCIEK